MAGRRKGFFAAMAANAARAQREAERSRKRSFAEQERAARAAARWTATQNRLSAQALKAVHKDARLRHQEQRQQEVDELNERTAATTSELRGILQATLSVNDTV